MYYINTNTLEYPVTRGHLERLFSDTIFPRNQPIDVPGYQFVATTPKPAGDVVTEGTPVLQDGAYVQVWEVRPYNQYELEQFRARKQETINNDFNTSVAALKNGYTEDEIKSWDKQEQEARAWTADNLTPTPLLNAMVAVRGDTVAELAARIIANADAWTAAYGAILGSKHAREANLNAIDLGAPDALAQIEAV